MRLAWLILTVGGTGIAQDFPPQYRFDTWNTDKGLPQNSVKAITQTKDGYLWFCTKFGVVRFDGVSFRNFDRANTPGLQFDNFIALAEDYGDGGLWLASPRGIMRYKDGAFVTTQLGEDSTTNLIWSISPSRPNGIWIASESGLTRFGDGRMVTYTNAAVHGFAGYPIRSVLEEDERTVWVGSISGLFRLDPVTGQTVNVMRSQGAMRCLFLDPAGTLWIGTLASGIWRLDRGSTQPSRVEGLPGDNVASITQDSDGNYWIGFQEEGPLLRYREGKFTAYTEKEGIPDGRVFCVYEDRERNLWVGTEFGGVVRMQKRRVYTYSAKDGLPHNNVWSIARSRDAGLWIGTQNGLARFNNGAVTHYRLGPNPEDNVAKAVLEDRAGNVWVGTTGAGLKRFRHGEITHYATVPTPTHDAVNAVYEDVAGNIWVGTTAGLVQFRDGRIIRKFTTRDGLSTNDVRALHENRDGSLWIATYGGGLNLLRNDLFTAYSTRDGLSDNFVWAFCEDSEGVLWIGTENGLTRYKDRRFTAYTTREGLFDNVVNDVLEDNQGNLWISCNRGIYRVAKRELHDVGDGRKERVTYVLYGIPDGMLSSETNGENQPAACKTADGKLWFPTTEGIVMIQPDELAIPNTPPPIVIEEVRIDGEPFDPLERADLPAGRGGVVEFRYTANSFVAPDKVLFRHFLDGWEKDWSAPDTRRVAYYANLRPGRYTFRLEARNNHGVLNTDGPTFSFNLAPYYYETKAFYAACLAGALLAGYSLHQVRLRVAHKIAGLERRHALEKERTRIANEMHDDLGSSLTHIALLSELAQRNLPQTERVGEHLRQITDTTREVFRAMDEIVWAVNPQHDTLSSLAAYLARYAENLLRPVDIRCRLDLPDAVPPNPLTTDERHNLFLTVKEALNNVVKHAAASEVWFRVILEDHSCFIAIEDNGRGFNLQTARPDGNGIRNMRERMAVIGGELTLESNRGRGTRLVLRLPLRSAPRSSLN